jgi:tetratricopeptide (TPR) repeat protein
MNSSPPTLQPEEQEQLLQTIEMFEVIVQANPQDTQSMEILRDAYTRLGMKKESLSMIRRLAQALADTGQFSAALLEYENVLKLDPDNVEIIAAMGDVEERMHKAGQSRQSARASAIEMDYKAAVSHTGTLMTTANTARPDGYRSVGPSQLDEIAATLSTDGNEALAKFLIQHRLATEDVVKSALERVQKRNESLQSGSLGVALIDEVVHRGGGELEAILSGILDRTKFAFIPLEYYDVDRQIAKMLPEDISLSRLMVPFDVMSRTVMIATANPFDGPGKEAAQQILDYNIQWHLASPTAIVRVLQQVYRIGEFAVAGGTPREAAAEPAARPAPAPIENVPLQVAASGAPAAAPEQAPAPLPDTSTFRLKS